VKAEREAAGSKMDNAWNLETRGPLQDARSAQQPGKDQVNKSKAKTLKDKPKV
jgi:hypothetical protein